MKLKHANIQRLTIPCHHSSLLKKQKSHSQTCLRTNVWGKKPNQERQHLQFTFTKRVQIEQKGSLAKK